LPEGVVEGSGLGVLEGLVVGSVDGLEVGDLEGHVVGPDVDGATVGSLVGLTVGQSEGFTDGETVGGKNLTKQLTPPSRTFVNGFVLGVKSISVAAGFGLCAHVTPGTFKVVSPCIIQIPFMKPLVATLKPTHAGSSSQFFLQLVSVTDASCV